jgi:peptidoglycan hydrolase-like protein with peptidoglycan-binding domain
MPKNKYMKAALIVPSDIIKPGAFGYDVYNLQCCLDHILKYRGKSSLHVQEPAHYGPKTRLAVRDFQAKYGLFINGEYTPCTRLRIKEVLDADRNI